MSDFKGTPGPWRVRENPGHAPDKCDLSICGDIFVLADVNGPNYAHCEANARLIAAAPEMLAALQTFIDQWNACGPNSDFGRYFKSVRDAAVAVTQKATGNGSDA